MSHRRWITFCVVGVVLIAIVLAIRLNSGVANPVAIIRVVDSNAKPVAGAVIQADGLRPKAGPYHSGHYGWGGEKNGVRNDPVITDKDGVAQVPYPKYVLEQIETGEISFSVEHPGFVSDRPFRAVDTSPPTGAPVRAWLEYTWDKICHRTLLAKTEPVILTNGAILIVSTRSSSEQSGPLFAQVSGVYEGNTNFWTPTEDGRLITRRLASGSQSVRAVRFDADGLPWFSDIVDINAKLGRTNEVVAELKRGFAFRGELDSVVPRPIKNGRIVVNVSSDAPGIRWHSWSSIDADGHFEFQSLPVGTLEVTAICDGFVSANGKPKATFHYPQTNSIDAKNLSMAIKMEPTARLEVHVTDEKGQPVGGARVSTWPNVYYVGWGSTILLSDCYNTADILKGDRSNSSWWRRSVPDFEGTSDASGLAVLANLPLIVDSCAVTHSNYVLAAVDNGSGQKRRQVDVSLVAGQTNSISVQVHPKGKESIRHF